MARINVGVLRGGPSNEYDVSLATGAAVLAHLPDEKYNTRDIFISKNGDWHTHGIPTDPGKALNGVDVVFNALHGEYGEGGTVQNILDVHHIPYTGSGVFASSLAMNKAHTQEHVGVLEGVHFPRHVVLRASDVAEAFQDAANTVFAAFGPRYIVKPLRGGSSLGIRLANTYAELPQTLAEALAENDAVIVEEFIDGREGTCGVIDNFRDEATYALPPIEIRYGSDPIWGYTAKYDDTTEEICPANFSTSEKETMQNAARRVHEALGLKHYSRSDFIIAPSGIYFLEVNSLPGIAPSSLLPKALEAVGTPFPDFLEHVVHLALTEK